MGKLSPKQMKKIYYVTLHVMQHHVALFYQKKVFQIKTAKLRNLRIGYRFLSYIDHKRLVLSHKLGPKCANFCKKRFVENNFNAKIQKSPDESEICKTREK